MAMKNKVILFGYYFSIFAVSTTTASYSAGEIRESASPLIRFAFVFATGLQRSEVLSPWIRFVYVFYPIIIGLPCVSDIMFAFLSRHHRRFFRKPLDV